MLLWISLFVLLIVLPAGMVARRWSRWDDRRRRTALRAMLVLLGGLAVGFTMARLVDAGFTASWPGWGRTVWVVVMFASLFVAMFAWKRLAIDPDPLTKAGHARGG
jgi:thiol:disulfide interchange protein